MPWTARPKRKTTFADFHPFRFALSLEPFGMSVVTPIADKLLQCRDCPLCAMNGQTHRNMIGAKKERPPKRWSFRNPVRCFD